MEDSARSLERNANLLLDFDKDDLERVLKYYNVSQRECDDMVYNVAEWFEIRQVYRGLLDNEIILRHLITTSFSVERAKIKITNYFGAKRKMPDILSNRDPLSASLSHYLEAGYWLVLPKRTPQNHRVTIFRIKTPSNFQVTDLIKLAFMIGDYRLRNDAVIGEHWIFNFENAMLPQAFQMNPLLIANIAFYLNSCICPRLKGVHIANLPPYAEKALFLFKKAMKHKLLHRIHIYKTFESIMKIFPEEIIPSDFGGEEVSSDKIADRWMKELQTPAWRKWFINQDAALNEDLQSSGRSAADEGFGTQGSFRRLDID